MFKLVKATVCLTPTSERSMSSNSWRLPGRLLSRNRDKDLISLRHEQRLKDSCYQLLPLLKEEIISCDHASMAELYPSIAQTAVVATALKVLLFPA